MFEFQVKQITCYRGDQRLVNKLSFSLSNGEITQIVGRNGVGKTTLLKSMVGIVPLHSGEVLWQGQSIQKDRLNYHENIYYLDHQIGIKSELTVLENIILDVRIGHKKNHREVLTQLGLIEMQNKLARRLSQGERQRLALVKLLLSGAALWILDEPFSSLDSEIMNTFQAIMEAHCHSGGGIVFTSHQGAVFPKLALKILHLPLDFEK